jgi:hypothetical protein
MKKPKRRSIQSSSVGLIAVDALSRGQSAYIFGNNSKGIYIKTSGKWLVFLSYDRFRGPLSITLDEVDPIFHRASVGRPVNITPQSLSLPDIDMTIMLQGGEIWPARYPLRTLHKDPGCYERVIYFAKKVLSNQDKDGLVNLLNPLLDLPNGRSLPQETGIIDGLTIKRLQKHIQDGEANPLAMLLSTMLGSGPGLTPSTDDFATGLLLTMNRWLNSNWTSAALNRLNCQVLEAAYAKTTSLSANLIECATLGLANERLVNALDWLVTGVAREPEIIAPLIGWGHSSGIDVFVGMAVTLSA